MLTQFLTAHSGVLCFVGATLGIGSGIWFLFASYGCDVQLAHWTFLLPPLALLLVIRYPETCLRPFLLSLLALLIFGVGWSFYFTGHAGSVSDFVLPETSN